MAGDWIKVEVLTISKPEVLRISKMLKLDQYSTLGRLIAFWAWADATATDGVLQWVTSLDIDKLVNKRGFSDALAAVGWLEIDPKRELILIPNFHIHNGKSAKSRALKTRRQQKWRTKVDGDASTDVDAINDIKVSLSASTREEKRKEDNKKEDTYASSKKNAARKVASRIPENWRPSPEDIKKATDTGYMPEQISDLAEQFVDHWKAKGGKNAAKLDWSATWRNWIKNDIRFNGLPTDQIHPRGAGRNVRSGSRTQTASLTASHRNVSHALSMAGQDDGKPRIRY